LERKLRADPVCGRHPDYSANKGNRCMKHMLELTWKKRSDFLQNYWPLSLSQMCFPTLVWTHRIS